MKYLRILISTRITLVLLIAFATSMAVATFIENDHGTQAARSLVYEAWWFELLMIWLATNFLAHVDQYKLLHRNRWPVALFHIAFVIIILGAGITRHFGREGVIHIREGQQQNIYYSAERFLQVRQIADNKAKHFERQVDLNSYGFETTETSVVFDKQPLRVIFTDYTKAARAEITKGEKTIFDIAVAVNEDRNDHLIPEDDFIQIGEALVGINDDTTSTIRIHRKDTTWMITSKIHLQVMDMATQQMSVVHAGETRPLKQRSLYQLTGAAFVIKAIHDKSAIRYISEANKDEAKNLSDVVRLKVTDESGKQLTEAHKTLVSYNPAWHSFMHEGKHYLLTYGPRAQKLPFSLTLSKFDLQRYPGSQSPSSYASNLVVKGNDVEFPYRVFMNNVLDHEGYRFYQSSFDADEKGTILSVNQDRPGTYVTYTGYLLLAIGMFFTFFAKGSRVSILNKKLKMLRKRSAGVQILLMFFLYSANSFAQGQPIVIPEEKASEYGNLVVQDLDGRMKPLNTLANEIIRKLNGRSKITISSGKGEVSLNAEQFLLAVQIDPQTFSQLPVIKIDKDKSHEAFKALGIQPTEKISFKQFINENGDYLLHDLVEEANRRKPAERNEAHKEILKTDERFNIFYALLSGDFLRIFPNKTDKNNTWFTSQQWQQGFDEEDARFVKNITPVYLAGLVKGVEQKNWEQADKSLEYIRLFQKHAGNKVYPNDRLLNTEILYNQLKLGNRLFGWFWILGVLMLAVGIIMLFKESRALHMGWKAGVALSWIGLLVFSIHLGLRWYIANHPPWSDGFEMLVFVAWGVLLFGLIFASRSKFTIPLSLLFSGTLLFVAFLDWLNPEITNLMPVLNSYWLKIHVAIIVSSYAPLALAAILALLSLMFMIFKPSNPSHRWLISQQELLIVNELAITIGLFLLAIGTFLGGIWANESWGRYWAWDPKETWALISVIVYAFVLHLRLIPAMNNALVYNVASLWAFSSIIMTSFGVNYYLSGLHSYAAGDPVPIPQWVYWTVALLLMITIAAIMRYRRINNREAEL